MPLKTKKKPWFVWIRTVWLNWKLKMKCFWQLNCVLMLNWIVWNGTVLCVTKIYIILNWIVWNETVFVC